ncbi:single-stranded DNA-binding protein [Patescibacteria group bacterium]|nr:single-stranded DNA-binding protein [Patescibacteria group bacterium]
MNFNKIIIIGNLTRDPELRQTPNGTPVASFSIATNRMFTDKAGQKQKTTEFHNVVAWSKLGELVGQYLKKGQMALVEGRLQTRSWDDKTSGQKRYRTEIVAENVQFGPKSGTFGGTSAGSPTSDESAPETLETVEYPSDNEEIKPEDIPF